MADDDRRSAFNQRVIAEFRARGGRVGGELERTSILLLHHVGARSGLPRVTPLAYNRLGDGRILIAAANGGSPTHPAWYHNLKAHPRVVVEIGTERFTAVTEELRGVARAAAWAELASAAPTLRAFQAGTDRRLPLFAMSRS